MARRAKKNTSTLVRNIDKVRTQAKTIHDTTLSATDTIVDEVVAVGSQWQDVLAKALKQGVKLMAKQQDFLFDTLESVKGQVQSDGIKAKNLLGFGKNKSAKTVVKEANELVIKTKKVAAKKTRKATNKVKTTAKKVKATANTVVKSQDLKIIEGVGPKMESLLNAAGINTYEQLAKSKIAALKEVLATAGPRFKKINPSDWTKQARLAAANKMEALEALKSENKKAKTAAKK